MITRLVLGLLKGVLLGAMIVAGFHYGIHWDSLPLWLAFVAAGAAGVMSGLFTGKAIWQKNAKIEAGLKAFVGALLGAGAMWAIHWLKLDLTAASLAAPFLPLREAGDVSVATLPMVTTLLALIFELDNTPAPPGEAAPKSVARARIAGGKVRVGGDETAELEEIEPAASRRAKR